MSMSTRTLAQLWPPSSFICRACRLARRQTFLGPPARRSLGTRARLVSEDSEERPIKARALKYVEVKDAPNLARPLPFTVTVTEGEDDQRQTEDFKARLDKMEDELRQIRRYGVFGDQSFLSQLSEEEREVVDSVIEKSKLDGSILGGRLRTRRVVASPKQGDQKAVESDQSSLAPREQRGYLNRFNGYLKQAERRGTDPENRKQLWRWYMRCRQNVPTFRAQVSAEIWNTLWETQSVLDTSNPDRASHLRILAEDIEAGGQELTAAQRIAYIEALFLEDQHAAAISEWEGFEKKQLIANPSVANDFLELGIRMFAVSGDLQRAQKVAHNLLNVRGSKEYRVLLPVMRAWSKKGGSEGYQRAWALYLCLREGLGTSGMTMKDYDLVTDVFLGAGKADLALGVFRDMMLTGDVTGQTSSALYQKAIGTVIDLRNLAIDAATMNQVTFDAMAVLPRRFQNKFFFGSWIKKLLGAAEPDSAMLVVELMSKRGLQPDPKILNGIIGAWTREGEPIAREKAEGLAWTMIEKRKQHAWERRLINRGEEATDDPSPRPLSILAKLPPATMETFNLMAEYYLERGNHAQIRWLHRSLRLSALEPSPFFMNQVMFSQSKTEGFGRVWQTYLDWSRRHTAQAPNAETWSCLWECRKQGVSAPPTAASIPSTDSTNVSSEQRPPRESDSSIPWNHHPSPPSPRSLFSIMTAWHQSTADASSIPESLHPLVLQTFLFSTPKPTGDLPAALVSMHALQSLFGASPTEMTTKMLVLHLARLEKRSTPPGRSPGKKRDANEGVRIVAKRMEQLAESRMQVLPSFTSRRVHPSEGPILVTAEAENLWLLSELLRGAIGRNLVVYEDDNGVENEDDKDARSKQVQHKLERAAWDMGVGGLDTRDYLTGKDA